jgi:hypothetical protein
MSTAERPVGTMSGRVTRITEVGGMAVSYRRHLYFACKRPDDIMKGSRRPTQQSEFLKQAVSGAGGRCASVARRRRDAVTKF